MEYWFKLVTLKRPPRLPCLLILNVLKPFKLLLRSPEAALKLPALLCPWLLVTPQMLPRRLLLLSLSPVLKEFESRSPLPMEEALELLESPRGELVMDSRLEEGGLIRWFVIVLGPLLWIEVNDAKVFSPPE